MPGENAIVKMISLFRTLLREECFTDDIFEGYENTKAFRWQCSINSSRRCSEAVSSLATGPRADSLPWFDSPLVQGASRPRYTDKAQMQRPGHTGRKALATKKKRQCSINSGPKGTSIMPTYGKEILFLSCHPNRGTKSHNNFFFVASAFRPVWPGRCI